MRVVNNSLGKPYYTQRNNRLSPGAACNVTAMVSALAAAGWPFPAGPHEQPEDNLMTFIRSSPQVLRRWDVLDPAHKIPPNEWHELLCLGTNLWLAPFRGPEIRLRFDLRLEDVARAVGLGGAVVMSGRFETERSEIGHIVSVVGFRAEDSEILSHLILDDPWGDYRTRYRSAQGDDVFMPAVDFYALLRPWGETCKLGHVVPAYAAGGGGGAA
jgi:hypothetical protein